MSTLEECKNTGKLITIGGGLRRHQLPVRLLTATPPAVEWMKTVLPTLTTDNFIPGSTRPLEQADNLFRRFVSGADFDPPVPHQMRPLGQGVWRLRTPDLRLDGWFPQKCIFVIANADQKRNTKKPGRDDLIFQLVLETRANLNLFGGKYEESEDYHDLI